MENKSQKNVINVLYILLILSTILSFVPSFAAQTISLGMVAFTLFAAYFYQMRDKEDGLLYNHMTYMIGTIWIGTGFIALGIILMGIWVYLKGDQTVFQNAVDAVMNGAIMDSTYIQTLTIDYFMANRQLFILSGLVTLGPGIAYFVYRVANGYGRAMKGYRIANPKAWL